MAAAMASIAHHCAGLAPAPAGGLAGIAALAASTVAFKPQPFLQQIGQRVGTCVALLDHILFDDIGRSHPQAIAVLLSC